MTRKLIITTLKEATDNPEALIRDYSHEFVINNELSRPYVTSDFIRGLNEQLWDLIHYGDERIEVMIFTRTKMCEEEEKQNA